jgi:hypothetical protein
MLIKGTALVWVDDQEMELAEGGIVFLPKNIPHAYRITSKTADLLMINTPAGIEGMFRYSGRDKATPRPEGFEISPARLAEGADKFGQIILGPRADAHSSAAYVFSGSAATGQLRSMLLRRPMMRRILLLM